MARIIGVGASTPWKESNKGTRFLEWFAWSEANEIALGSLHSQHSSVPIYAPQGDYICMVNI